MKKVLYLFLFSLVFLVGCVNENNDVQVLNKAIEQISFPEETSTDILLVDSLEVDGNMVYFEWNFSKDTIDSKGKVTQGEADVFVIVTAKVTVNNYSIITDIATIKVLAKQKEIDYETILNEGISKIALPEKVISNIIFDSFITVNNYTINLVWESDNEAITSDGVVTRGDTDIEVTITCIASIENISKEVEYNIVVLALEQIEGKEFISELLLIDYANKYIEMSGCNITKLADNIEVLYLENDNYYSATIDDLMIGLSDLKVYVTADEISKIVIPYDYTFTTIRVAIRNSINDIADSNTLYHDSVTLNVSKITKAITFDGIEEMIINPGTVTITIENGILVVKNGTLSKSFDRKVIIEATNSEIEIKSISRGGSLKYAGSLDFSIVSGRILMVNEVGVEEYLRKVVPSEMPSSWNKEALKAQSVAARTYAYCEYYNKKYLEYGYVVDDSTQSQVYNNQVTTMATDTAIKETEGIVMFNNNMPIIAYYYSSSCGLTGSGNEVWIKNGIISEIPYLIGKNLSTDSSGNTIQIDSTSESSMLNYFKMIKFTNPGGASSYHRWKIAFTKAQLKNTLEANLPNMVASYPDSYPQLIDEEWVISDFPSDIGEIQDVYVSCRGASGVVVSLTIVTSKITFKIYNQYNIRFTIRGRDAGSTVTLYYGSSSNSDYKSHNSNPSILNSGYFALEWNNDSLTFYGGGNGHGVGMDQYGANYYASNGKTYEDILNIYYSNIEFIQTIR